MKKLIAIYGLLLVLFPFLVKPITAKAFDYDYNNFIKIDSDDKFSQEKQSIKNLYIFDPQAMEVVKKLDTTGDLIAYLSEDFGINLEENDFIAVVDFNYNVSKNADFRPPFFKKEYIKYEEDPQNTWQNKKITLSAYFFGTNEYNNFSFPLTESTGRFNCARYITDKDTLKDTFTYRTLNKTGYKTYYETLTYKIHIDSLYKYQPRKGYFELRKIDQIAKLKSPKQNTPKTIFNYAYAEQKFDANFNLEPTGKRTLFASYAIPEFHNYIAQQEQQITNFFANINPTRNLNEIKAYSEVQIQGKTVQVPWYSSPLTKTEGTLGFDINGKLHIFYNDDILNKVKAQRLEQLKEMPMVRNTDIKRTDTFKDPNDLYNEFAENYEEAKLKQFITSLDEFEQTIDTSNLEIQDPISSTWYPWRVFRQTPHLGIEYNQIYKIRETQGPNQTIINISFYYKEPHSLGLNLSGKNSKNNYDYIDLEFGKVLGNFEYLYLQFQPFPPSQKEFGIDYYLETYYSATDNSYDYTKYQNISDSYGYVDDSNEYKYTKHGYYVFRLFNSLTNEVKEYCLHYAPKVDADTTEHKDANGEYHYTEHSVKNVLPHINELDSYDVYYSVNEEINQDNFHSHTKLTTDDFGKSITPNTTSSKHFKKGFYLVKYKAKTEDTYKFTKFEIKAQDLKYEFYNGTDKLDSSQLSPDPIYTNKLFKLNVLSPKEHWQLEVWKLNTQTNKWSKIPGKWNDNYISDEGIFKLKLRNLQAYKEFEQIFTKSNASPTFELANVQKDLEPNTYISGTNPVLTLNNIEYQLTVQNSTTGQTLVQNEYRETFEFTTDPESTTEYLVKITDKHGNFVEFTVKVDKRAPKLSIKTPDNQSATLKLEHLGLPTYDTNLKFTKSTTDKIIYSKNNSTEIQYNGETLTQGIYTTTITNKLGLKTTYQFAIYTTPTEFNTEINGKNQVIDSQNQEFYTNSKLPGQFIFAKPVYWQFLTVYEIKDGKETELLKINTNFQNTLTVQELGNLTKNGKFKYVFTDILGKTREFTVERNTELGELDIQIVNQHNKTNGDITISHSDPKAKLFVNGIEQPLPHKITENGKYELKLVDKFGNKKTYTVERKKQELAPTLKDLETEEPIQGEEIGKPAYFELESDWQLYEFQENDWKLVENRPNKIVLDKHQTYQYKIVDSFGNEKVIKLTVSLEIGEIKHNLTRPERFLTNKPATFDWQDPSITAVFKETNESYTKGSAIEKPGKYTLVFTDKFGHTKEITFEYRPKLDKIELIANNQRTVLKHSTIAVNHNFKFDTTNNLFLFNKGKWQPITPNYEFSKEATYKFKATDKFGNEMTFTVQYKRLATIKREENQLTVIVVSIFSAILVVLIIIILVLKIKNNVKNSPFKQKKTPTKQPKK